MNQSQKYYPLGFEAQYEETSQKMIEIAQQHRDQILATPPSTTPEMILADVDDINEIMDQQDLLFRKAPIYSQFATGPEMKEKTKRMPQNCPECGEELKKHTQCEFCAECFCTKCCQRKRVIPFVSKDARICCEQCHFKFVKLFDNKFFYEEKEKLLNVINFVKNKTNRIMEKIEKKQVEVDEYRQEKRNDKIKEKNVENKVIQEEKKLKQAQEQWRQAISRKAEKIKQKQAREAQQRREKEEKQERERQERLKEQMEKLAREEKEREEERKKVEEDRRKSEQKEKEANQTPIKPLLNQAEGVASEASESPSPSTEKKVVTKEEELMEAMRKREEQLKRKEQELRQKELEIERKNVESRRESINSTPKVSINTEEAVKSVETRTGTKSRRESEEIPPTQTPDKLRKNCSERAPDSSSDLQAPSEDKTQEIADPLERSLAKMFKPKKEDDSKSLYSAVSRTSKSVLDMSVNELLAVRIPQTGAQPAAPKPAERQSADRFSQPYSPQLSSEKLPGDSGVGLPELQEEEIRIHRDSVIRNSTLLTGNKESVEPVQQTAAPEKCKCELM